MTSKGQITIPIQIREALGLKPGVRVDFYEFEEGAYALRPKTHSIKELEGCLSYAGPVITIEEMNQAVLDQATELDARTKSNSANDLADEECA